MLPTQLLTDRHAAIAGIKIKKFRLLYNFDEEDNTIQIYHIGHRKDVYQQFRRLLNELKKTS